MSIKKWFCGDIYNKYNIIIGFYGKKDDKNKNMQNRFKKNEKNTWIFYKNEV